MLPRERAGVSPSLASASRTAIGCREQTALGGAATLSMCFRGQSPGVVQLPLGHGHLVAMHVEDEEPVRHGPDVLLRVLLAEVRRMIDVEAVPLVNERLVGVAVDDGQRRCSP